MMFKIDIDIIIFVWKKNVATKIEVEQKKSGQLVFINRYFNFTLKILCLHNLQEILLIPNNISQISDYWPYWFKNTYRIKTKLVFILYAIKIYQCFML